MKVNGPGGVKGPSKTNKKDKSSSSDTSFGDMVSKGTTQSAATTTAQSIAMVDSLLAVQEAEDPTERKARRRMHQRSSTLLDELDKIRMGMLNGSLTVGHMIDIADVVASHREKIADPALTAVMDEIDLRAQVELAKLRVSLDAVESNDNNVQA